LLLIAHRVIFSSAFADQKLIATLIRRAIKSKANDAQLLIARASHINELEKLGAQSACVGRT